MAFARGPYCEPNPYQAAALERMEWVLDAAGYGDMPEIHLVVNLWQKTGRRYDPILGLSMGERVYIDAQVTPDTFIDNLIHETAHAVADRSAPWAESEHSALWGTVYAKLYDGWRAVGGPTTVLRKTPLK